jgi:hypothetical protein
MLGMGAHVPPPPVRQTKPMAKSGKAPKPKSPKIAHSAVVFGGVGQPLGSFNQGVGQVFDDADLEPPPVNLPPQPVTHRRSPAGGKLFSDESMPSRPTTAEQAACNHRRGRTTSPVAARSAFTPRMQAGYNMEVLRPRAANTEEGTSSCGGSGGRSPNSGGRSPKADEQAVVSCDDAMPSPLSTLPESSKEMLQGVSRDLEQFAHSKSQVMLAISYIIYCSI